MSRFFPENFSKSIIDIYFFCKNCIFCLGYGLCGFVVYIEWKSVKNI